MGDATWQDYTINFDVMTEGSRDQMVFIRTVFGFDGYEINVRGEPWNDVHLYKWLGGVQHLLYVKTGYPNTTDQWNHFQIQANGPQIVLEFNGDLLFTYTDLSIPILSGGVALAAHAGGTITWQNAYYDNVVITTELPVSEEDVSWGEIKSLFR